MDILSVLLLLAIFVSVVIIFFILIMGAILLIMGPILIIWWVWSLLTKETTSSKLIYIICPVRNITTEQKQQIKTYVESLEEQGYQVHFPLRDVDQTDPIGIDICSKHLQALKGAARVDVFWDANSSGSHFDLGMAFTLGKKVLIVKLYQDDKPGKSFVKVMQSMQQW